MIERSSARLKAPDALCRPEPEGRDVVEHLGPEGRDGVFNTGRNLREDLARDESVALQSSERLREGLLADAFDMLHDAGEAHGLTVIGNHGHGPERPLVRDAGDHLARERIFGFAQGLAKFCDFFPTGF